MIILCQMKTILKCTIDGCKLNDDDNTKYLLGLMVIIL